MISILYRAFGANGLEVLAARETFAEDPGDLVPAAIVTAAESNASDAWTTIDHWQLELTPLEYLTASREIPGRAAVAFVPPTTYRTIEI